MHMLRNFIHATTVIMAGSGMKEVLASSFGRVDKMLSGNKYPQTFYFYVFYCFVVFPHSHAVLTGWLRGVDVQLFS